MSLKTKYDDNNLDEYIFEAPDINPELPPH